MENLSVSDSGSHGTETADHQHLNNDSGGGGGDTQQPLCASCDRCRARKTKCDGRRPCSNCVFKFMKKNKIERLVNSVSIRLSWRSSEYIIYVFNVRQ
jgi:hypothetical protein